jgi:transcriptional regulator with XRE-family HTH domain
MNQTFGALIKQERESSGLTLETLSRHLQDISPGRLEQIEFGLAEPKPPRSRTFSSLTPNWFTNGYFSPAPRPKTLFTRIFHREMASNRVSELDDKSAPMLNIRFLWFLSLRKGVRVAEGARLEKPYKRFCLVKNSSSLPITTRSWPSLIFYRV